MNRLIFALFIFCLLALSITSGCTITTPAPTTPGQTQPFIPPPKAKTTVGKTTVLEKDLSTVMSKNGWSTFTNGNDVRSLLVVGNDVWAVTGGGVVRFNVEEGNYRKFTTLDGLADNDVNAIARDNQGNLWFGTEGSGVSRYDGESWQTFTAKDGLASNYISVITLDADGNLWFGAHTGTASGTKPGGLSRYDGTRWQAFSSNDGLSNKSITAIYQDRSGYFWIAVGGFGLKRYSWNNGLTLLESFQAGDAPPGAFINAILQDNQGSLWFSGYFDWWHGTSRYDGQKFYDENAHTGGAVPMAVDSEGNIWFGGGTRVIRFDGSNWLTIASANDLNHSHVRSIVEDGKGTIWFGTSNGIIRYQNDRLDTFLTEDTLASNLVTSIAKDNYGNMWFSSYLGISRLGKTGWSVFHKQDGLPGGAVMMLVKDAKGNIWALTTSGVAYYDGTRWQNFSVETLGANINSMAADREGKVWFGTQGEGVVRWNGQDWTTFTQAKGLLGDYLTVLSDAHGNIWAERFFQGISLYEGGETWQPYIMNGLEYGGILAALKDNKGTLWFGTTKGIVRDEGKGLRLLTDEDGVSVDHVTSIIQDASGRVWFGTYGHGVILQDGGNWTTFTTRNGLANNYVTSVLQDEEGNLWFGTHAGVSLYQPK